MKKQIDCAEKDWSDLCILIDKAIAGSIGAIKDKTSDDHKLQIVLENISLRLTYAVAINVNADSGLPILASFPDEKTCVLDIDFGQMSGSKYKSGFMYKINLDCSRLGVVGCKKAIHHLLCTMVLPSIKEVCEVEIHLINSPSEIFREVLMDSLNVDKSLGMFRLYLQNGIWFTFVETYLNDPTRTEVRFPHNVIN